MSNKHAQFLSLAMHKQIRTLHHFLGLVGERTCRSPFSVSLEICERTGASICEAATANVLNQHHLWGRRNMRHKLALHLQRLFLERRVVCRAWRVQGSALAHFPIKLDPNGMP